MRFVVAISGKARSGKDHLAQLIAKELGMRRIGFADLVKEAACFFLPWREGGSVSRLDRETIEEWKTSERVPEGWDVTMREALIIIGDRFREICPTVWMDSVLEVGDDNIVIPDTRYENELSAVNSKEHKYVVRVWAPERQGAGKMAENRSETELDHIDEEWGIAEMSPGVHYMPPECPYDVVVVNASSLEAFEEMAQEVIQSIREAAIARV